MILVLLLLNLNMKTYKYIWINSKSFNYEFNNFLFHGLWNDGNESIGYWYQHKWKGFWLEKKNYENI